MNICLLTKKVCKQSVLLVFQAELIVGDQSGVIHIWDLKTDQNEQLIPEPEVSVNSVHIDPDASYMAAVNSSVRSQISLKGFLFMNALLNHTQSLKEPLWSFCSPSTGKLLCVEPCCRHRR